MLGRFASRTTAATKALLRCPNSILLSPAAASSTSRLFGTGDGDAASPQERLALDMIRYALGHARSQKSGDSYAHAMLVLEQGLSNLRGGGAAEGSDNAIGMLMLAMSTLHYERGELPDAADKLELVRQLGQSSLDLRVSACESQVGLKLEEGQDATSSLLADDCSNLLRTSTQRGLPISEVTKLRVKSIKGLVDLVNGDVRSAELSFDGFQNHDLEGGEHQLEMGNGLLSQGEVSHCTGNFSIAKELYEKALLTSETTDASSISYLPAANMVPEEVTIGATCALGQLLFHSGKFEEAEELLTKALVKAEEHFGSTHPKVGVVLTCIAIMYKHKAQMEASSSILIQEGLYRKAMDLLKAPTLSSEVPVRVDRCDIVALARGGYADLLCVQQNRKEEGERMKKWAQSMWRSRRLSLAEALEFSEPSKSAVVDTRICRVL